MIIKGTPDVLFAPKTPGAFGGLGGLGESPAYKTATKYGGIMSLPFYVNILSWIRENNPTNEELQAWMQKWQLDDDDISNAYGIEGFKAIVLQTGVQSPFENRDVYSHELDQAKANVASLGLTIDDLEFAAGEANKAANAAAAAARQRQDDEVAQAAARAAAAYAAQAQALNEVIFSAGTETATENALIADKYTQQAENATRALDNAIKTSDEETNTANAALKAAEAAAMIAKNVQNAAQTVTQKVNAFVRETEMIKLPANWDKYSAAQKIEYFNNNYITEKMLLADGVSQDDIDWMKQNGYTGMPEEPTRPDPLPKQIQVPTQTNAALPLIVAAAAAYLIGA